MYINIILSIFGFYYEQEMLASWNLMIHMPGWDPASELKLWYHAISQSNSSTHSIEVTREDVEAATKM